MTALKIPSNRTKELTPNQLIYFNAIVKHVEEFHSFPTCADIGNTLGVNVNAAYEMIRRLIKKGFLEEWRKGVFRVRNVSFVPKFKRNQRRRVEI